MTPESETETPDPVDYLPGRPLHVGPFTHAYFDGMEKMYADAGEALSFAGGNLRIEFYNGEVFTLVTSGSQIGVYYEPIDVPIHFEMKCEEWFLNNILDPDLDDDYDIEGAMIFGGVELEGDLKVYERLCRFKNTQNSAAVRAGGAKPPRRTSRRRRRSI